MEAPRRIFIIICLIVLPLKSFALESKLLPVQKKTEAAQTEVKVDRPTPMKILGKNIGIGFASGVAAGAGFILLSRGQLPSNNADFDGNALLTGISAGIIGGIAFTLAEIKKQKALRISVSPPNHLLIPAHLAATYEY